MSDPLAMVEPLLERRFGARAESDEEGRVHWFFMWNQFPVVLDWRPELAAVHLLLVLVSKRDQPLEVPLETQLEMISINASLPDGVALGLSAANDVVLTRLCPPEDLTEERLPELLNAVTAIATDWRGRIHAL